MRAGSPTRPCDSARSRLIDRGPQLKSIAASECGLFLPADQSAVVRRTCCASSGSPTEPSSRFTSCVYMWRAAGILSISGLVIVRSTFEPRKHFKECPVLFDCEVIGNDLSYERRGWLR
jgi:hypothetical protein